METRKSTRSERYEAIFWIAPLLFLCAIVFPTILLTRPGIWIYESDTYLPFYPAEANYDLFWTSWGPYLHGGVNSPNLYGLLMFPFTQFLGGASVGRLTFLLDSISALTMYLCLYKTKLVRQGPVRLAASAIYGFDWATLENTNLRLYSSTGAMLFRAAAPLVVLFLFRVLVKRERLLHNSLGLALTLAAGSILNPILVPSMIITSVPVLAASFLATKGEIRRRLLSILAVVLSFGLCGLLTLPLYGSYIYNVYTKGLELGFQAQYGFKAYLTTYHSSLYIEWFQRTYPYVFSPLLVLTGPQLDTTLSRLGMLIPIVILLFLLLRGNRIAKALVSTFLLEILAFTLYVRLVTTDSQIIGALASIPATRILLGAYLTPTQVMFALSLLLAFALAIVLSELAPLANVELASPSLDLTFPSCRARRVAMAAILILMVSSATLSNGGQILRQRDLVTPVDAYTQEGGWHWQPGNYMPDYFFSLVDFFNEERHRVGPFRVLWLPEGHPQYVTFVGIADPMSYVLPPRSKLWLDLYREAMNSLSLNNTYIFPQFLATQNMRYVVILKDFNQTTLPFIRESLPTLIFGDPLLFKQLFDRTSQLSRIQDTGNYTLYRNSAWCPMVSSTSFVYLFNDTATLYRDMAIQAQVPPSQPLVFMIRSNNTYPAGFVPGGLDQSQLRPFIVQAPVANTSLEIHDPQSYYNNRYRITSFGIPSESTKGHVFLPTESNLSGILLIPGASSRVHPIAVPLPVHVPFPPPVDDVVVSLETTDQSGKPNGTILARTVVQNSKWLSFASFQEGQDADRMAPLFVPLRYDGLSLGKKYAIFLSRTGPMNASSYFSIVTRNCNPEKSGEDWYTVANSTAYSSQSQFDMWLVPLYESISDASQPSLKLLSYDPFYSPSTYTVSADISSPVFIVLGQSYDTSWEAFTSTPDGGKRTYRHFEVSGWANGFYIDESHPVTVTIRFAWQDTYEAINLFWAMSVVGVVLGFLATRIHAKQRGMRKRICCYAFPLAAFGTCVWLRFLREGNPAGTQPQQLFSNPHHPMSVS